MDKGIKYSEHYMTKKAERFVNKIWVLDNSRNDQPVGGQMILPNGCFNLAIITGRGVEVITKDKTHILKEGIYLGSQMTEKVIANIEPHSKGIVIQLHAWTISFFPKLDFRKFKDIVIPFDLGVLELKYNLDSELWSDINHILDFTIKNFEDLNEKNPQKTLTELMCLQLVDRNEKISKKLKGIKYSNRALQIEFKKSTGLSRKQYSKLINLRKTVDSISNPESEKSNLTSIAHERGYFDQTHFVKTFKEIVKITPKRFNAQSYLLSLKR